MNDLFSASAPAQPHPRTPAAAPPADLDMQIGLFAFDAGEGLFVPATTQVQAQNEAILAINSAANYRIGESDRLGQGSLRNKAQDNLRAIRTLKTIQGEARHATPEEQASLVRYVGWGGLPKVFEDEDGEWADIGRELKSLLDEAEYAAAAKSTINAHYTAESVVGGIYDVLSHLGFSGGNVLEPGAGVGHFMGLMPDALSDNTRWTAVEVDPISAGIAAALYPDSTVLACGLEDAVLSNGTYDLAVGNVPFGQYSVHDPAHNPRRFSIHNYFIVRSLAALRPGGVVAVLTSRYTMDQKDSIVRRTIAEEADLIGAIRLPENTFRENANTEVVTDLLILKKREAGAAPAGAAWEGTTEIATEAGTVEVNEYFTAHPHMVLGTLGTRSGPFGPTLTVRASGETPLREQIAAAGQTLDSDGLFEHRSRIETPLATTELPASLAAAKEGAFVVLHGLLYVREGNSLAPHGLRNARDIRRVRQLVRIRDAVREVLRTQRDDESESAQTAARSELGYLYDVFVAEFGPVGRETRTTNRYGTVSVRRPNLTAFRRDPDAMLLASLEHYDAETDTARKADIFTHRVVRPPAVIDACESAQDALLVTLDQKGYVDLAHVAQLWGNRSEADVLDALGDQLFHDPEDQQWETADAYLSGNVRQKLTAARTAAETDPRYARNAEALEAVQPPDLLPSEIDASIGSSWIPKEDIAQFVRDLLGRVAQGAKIDISHIERDALWKIEVPYRVLNSVEATRTWGTGRADAIRLIEDALNQRLVQITDTVEEYDKEKGRTVKKTVRNVQETLDAQEKQQQIEERFSEWVWQNTERAQRLVAVYNQTFNNIRLRTYDGSHLTLPNSSDAIRLDPHQKNLVWRILQSGNTLGALVVGAGKTFAGVAAAIESKRLQLCSKPAVAVPNHMLEQFSREALQLYPTAQVLAAGSEDLAGDGRRRFLARAATGDWDLIVLTHAAANKIPMSAEFEEEFSRGEMERYEQMLAEIDKDDRLTRKQLEQAKQRLKVRLDQLANRSEKDNLLTFEETGIDALYVDEAQLFKNLDTPSKIQGIPRASRPSQRAQDLLMKTLYLDRIRPGRNVVFLTGTPISNTIAEVYVMLRYLAPRLLENAGMHHFDAWAANFTKRTHALELAPDGASYRVRTRFNFQNVAELVTMFRVVAEVQTAEMLNLPRPELEGGAIEMVAAPPSAELLSYVQTLVARAEAIYAGNVDPRDDNMLAVTNDGRKAALDMRLIDPELPDFADSKVNKCVQSVLEIYHRTSERRLTQMIFCDLSTPRRGFNVYDDVRTKLIAGLPDAGLPGIPADEVRFIHEAKTDLHKARMFADMRQGSIRVLLASTGKAGMGTNVQDLLYAMHELDAPWKPAEVEQRNGRILRRGNTNPRVRIIRYVTQESFDAYQWNLLEYKQRFISQIMCGDVTTRRVEDVDNTALSFAQLKALATGDPRVMERESVNADVIRLTRAKKAFEDRQYETRLDLVRLPEQLRLAERMLAHTHTDIAARVDTRADAFRITLEDTTYTERAAAAPVLRRLLMELSHTSRQRQVVEVGAFAGFKLAISAHRGFHPELLLLGSREHSVALALEESTAAGNLQVLDNLPYRMEKAAADLESAIEHLKLQIEELERIGAETFSQQATLDAALKRQRELDAALSDSGRSQDLSTLPEATLDEVDDEEAEADEADEADDEADYLAEAA